MLLVLLMSLAAQQAPHSPAHPSSACAASATVSIPPGDVLQRLDDFRAGLPARDRLRLDRALPRDRPGGIAQCDVGEGSRAACEAAAYMPALRRTRLMPRFLATICSKRPG